MKRLYTQPSIKSLLITLFCFLFLNLTSTAYADVAVQEMTTKKNICLLYVEDTTTDLTTVAFSFKGTGSAYDPIGKEGLASMMTDLIFEQTKPGLDRRSIIKRLKNIGVSGGINSGVDADNITFSFKAPTEKLKEVFALLKEVMTHPAFDPKSLDKLKSFDPSASRLATASESEFASKIFIQKVFNGQAYSKPFFGTLDGRQSVTLKDLEEAHKAHFARESLIFSVVGSVSPKNLISYIDNTFGHLPAKTNLPQISAQKIQSSGDITIVPKDTAQSGVVFGQPSLTRQDPNNLAMVVLNDILGGKPFTSRLWAEVREKRGLVYNIQTDTLHWSNASLLSGQFEAENQKVPEIIGLIKGTWKELKEKGVTEEEFNSSKKGLLGSFALNFTSPEGIAQFLLACKLAGLPKDYINQRNRMLEMVKLEDVNRVAKQQLDPELLNFVVVGKLEANN